jgi:U3 small nucleolar RNA-associated protein 13
MEKGKLVLKRRYERATSIAPFYTGGALVASRDGSRLACKCGGDVKLLDTATGGVVATISADAEDITALALSPSGHELVTAGRDMMVKTWDVVAQKKLRSWKSGNGSSYVQQLCYDETGTLVAGGCSDAVVRVWDAGRGFATHSLNGHGALITSLAFGPTPRSDPNKIMLFSGAEDGEVRIWALATKSCTAILKGHDSAVTAMALHMDTKTLVTGGRDRVVSVWDLETTKTVHSLPVYDVLEGLAIFDATKSNQASSKEDAGASKKRKKGKAAQQADEEQTVGAVQRGDLEVVTAGANGQLKRWRLGTGKCVASETERPGAAGYTALLSGRTGSGTEVLVAVTIEHTLLFFHPATLEIEKHMVGYNDEVLDVAFVSTEPSVLAVCTNSDHLRLFDTTSQSCRLLYGHSVSCFCEICEICEIAGWLTRQLESRLNILL